MENFQHDQPLAEIAAAQARLGEIDAAMDTLESMSGTKIADAINQVLSDLTGLGDCASLERLSKLVPSNDAIDQAGKKFKARSESAPKNQSGGASLPPGLMDDAAALVRMISFATSLNKDRLDGYIAVADAVSGDLDSACSRIDALNNPSACASTLLALAKAVTRKMEGKNKEK